MEGAHSPHSILSIDRFEYNISYHEPRTGVCLTQSLPPDQYAHLLILDSEDYRDVLYTVYISALNTGILARNILARTLVLDDTEDSRLAQLWNAMFQVLIGSLETWSSCCTQIPYLYAMVRHSTISQSYGSATPFIYHGQVHK
ncbi:hypothetical protein CC86DRAFT_80688 [Ophiobolus disseminans]|uniref:Uncharacterized protein n=1 Tax=Ophiobolus disseminans TaxID=1469910 RepID=A0A6A6ZQA8_9PLEO|nr:hypothetical protein CC86DRAFT_80688 [Ophiobolus disseminans]